MQQTMGNSAFYHGKQQILWRGMKIRYSACCEILLALFLTTRPESYLLNNLINNDPYYCYLFTITTIYNHYYTYAHAISETHIYAW